MSDAMIPEFGTPEWRRYWMRQPVNVIVTALQIAGQGLVREISSAVGTEAEVARLKLKCGEAAPDGTEIFPCCGPNEYVLCPTCGYEIEDPWDEPGVEATSDGWHGTLVCRNCAATIEVHHQIIAFWTAKKLADKATKAVEGAPIGA